jgi:crotonobetainyl-CoA:carnitine CoA-transferase CaiB-like acyl-CoA transferase
MADPQVRARGLRIDMPHPLAGTVPQIVAPIRMSATPLVPQLPPPLLAEHTAAVLRERLGLGAADLERLEAAGVVQTRPR